LILALKKLRYTPSIKGLNLKIIRSKKRGSKKKYAALSFFIL